MLALDESLDPDFERSLMVGGMFRMNEEHEVEDLPERLSRLLSAVGSDADREAFKELYEHFAPRLKSFFMRQGASADSAEEIVQESMVNVWRKAGQFDSTKASASTWIYAVARNMRIDLLRRANRPEPDVDDPAFMPDDEPQPLEILSKARDASRLRAIIATLPAEQRDVLHLGYFEDLAHGQIAEHLNIPLGTVKSRIRLAIGRIRAELGDEE